MGVEINDCASVSRLVAKKVFLSEFIAYKDLGEIIDFRNDMFSNGTFEMYRNGTLIVPNGMPIIWNVWMIEI